MTQGNRLQVGPLCFINRCIRLLYSALNILNSAKLPNSGFRFWLNWIVISLVKYNTSVEISTSNNIMRNLFYPHHDPCHTIYLFICVTLLKEEQCSIRTIINRVTKGLWWKQSYPSSHTIRQPKSFSLTDYE